MAKVPASSLTVFTLDGTAVVCKTENVALNIDVETEDGACLNDVWSSATVVGKSWSIEGSGMIDSTAFFTGKADTDPVLTVAITSGAKTYSGTGVLTRATHGIQRRQNQTESFSVAGVGALTVADPA